MILRIVKVNTENPWILWRNVDEWMRLGLAALISKLVEVVPVNHLTDPHGTPGGLRAERGKFQRGH